MMQIGKLLCGGLLMLNLVGCGTKTTTAPAETTTTTTTPTPAVVATDKAAAPAAASGFTALQGVVGATKKAIEAGKLDVAKTEFAKFETSWKTVEDGVKSKSADTYKAIEDGMESIDKGIASKQGKDALLASLQKLSQNIDKAGK
jgi:electron transfer flavoprotein alpha/beta subunit